MADFSPKEQRTLRDRLAILLREAERAHGDYEKTLGHRDDDWPGWYATYIAERLEANHTGAPTSKNQTT